MPSNAYNALLAVASQVKLWITPTRQSYAQIPAGAVPVWSEEFFTWCYAKLNFQNFPAPITYNKVLRALDEMAAAQPRENVQPVNLRSAATRHGEYEIDLGGMVVHLTGKQWAIKENNFDGPSRFLRPFSSRQLPHPTQSQKTLPEHLRAAFGFNEPEANKEDQAKALGQWLELALRPDANCPPLILTGEFRDEAAEALRQLIDPATCAMLPFPLSRGEAGRMALCNRVLAFQVFGKISTFKRKVVKDLSQGIFNVRLRQNDHKGPLRYQQLSRPVILTTGVAPEICGNQIVIEVKKCGQFQQQELLAALFNQMVHSLREEHKPDRLEPTERTPFAPDPLVSPQTDPPIP